MAATNEIHEGDLSARIEALPGFKELAGAVEGAGVDAWLVGGAVRDALIGAATMPNLDVAVAGDPATLAAQLGGEVRLHERFGTATVYLDSGSIDVAMTRAESYARPGALPDVRPAEIESDLARRDFTVNALAVSVAEPGVLIDPYEGLADLRSGVLRVLHDNSFVDDPTRALRAARYAARLDLEIEQQTLALLLDADFATVSADRVNGELERLAAEPRPARALAVLAEWGLVAVASADIGAFGTAAALSSEPRWRGTADLGRLLIELVRGDLSVRAAALAAGEPASGSEAVDLAGDRSGEELLLARAMGGEWLDRYVDEWRGVRLEISGSDLLGAGIPQGPAIGHGLEAALTAKLDGHAPTRDDELRIALETARS